jgi:hypothetical protein
MEKSTFNPLLYRLPIATESGPACSLLEAHTLSLAFRLSQCPQIIITIITIITGYIASHQHHSSSLFIITIIMPSSSSSSPLLSSSSYIIIDHYHRQFGLTTENMKVHAENMYL